MNLKDFFGHAATVILVVCAVIITVLVVRREFFQPEPVPAPAERAVENWQELEFLGNTYHPGRDKVRIIKFYDYECPWCKQAQPVFDVISDNYSDVVSIQYAHFPLGIHVHAREAAVAAECARKQNAFKNYHTLLFDKQEQIGMLSYIQLAEEAGVNDLFAFAKCLTDHETAPIVDAGIRLAEMLNVNMIPTFLINGTLVSGALSEEQLSGYVEEALENCLTAACK